MGNSSTDQSGQEPSHHRFCSYLAQMFPLGSCSKPQKIFDLGPLGGVLCHFQNLAIWPSHALFFLNISASTWLGMINWVSMDRSWIEDSVLGGFLQKKKFQKNFGLGGAIFWARQTLCSLKIEKWTSFLEIPSKYTSNTTKKFMGTEFLEGQKNFQKFQKLQFLPFFIVFSHFLGPLILTLILP